MFEYRWIGYTMMNIPGNLSFELDRFTSLEQARQGFIKFCKETGYDESHTALYAYSDEGWESAREFEGVGCPFDYPDRIIERGPRGGVVISRT